MATKFHKLKKMYNRTRVQTRDPQITVLMFYQLSYPAAPVTFYFVHCFFWINIDPTDMTGQTV